MTVIVTGAAGFIGFHVSRALLARGAKVVGIDNLNSYYDVTLKEARLEQLTQDTAFRFERCDVADRGAIFEIGDKHADATGVIHLAAQAGVRHSLDDPYIYVQSNVMGQVVMLELASRLKALKHFVYASSSSVYGGNTQLPFSVEDPVDRPNSLYAVTKRTDELLAYTYAHLYGLRSTGLRFFTVYGPWGRPDMAYFIFTRAILQGEKIRVFNRGEMSRDFTYIDDVVRGVLLALDRPATGTPPHAVYNLGNDRPEKLTDFISLIERTLGRTAQLQLEPMQPGDVPATWADIQASRRDLGFDPSTPLSVGLPKFLEWYRAYYKI